MTYLEEFAVNDLTVKNAMSVMYANINLAHILIDAAAYVAFFEAYGRNDEW